MKSKILGIIGLVIVTAMSTAAGDLGKTDGPEESEYGKGGNPFGSPVGRFYLNAAFGSGFFENAGLPDRTGFMYGIDLGYEMHDWIGIQTSYAYLSDQDLSIYSVGANFSYPWHPFVYNVGLDAGLYVPKIGERSFGIAPGAGVDIMLGGNIRLGLKYKHDFIFTDIVTTDVDRVYAGLKLMF